jgi:hypothetical protein
LPGEEAALELAIKRNQALPLVSLGASARGAADLVSIFYAQSGSVVAFMVEKLGPEKFAPFLRALKTDTLDNALKQTYGVDLQGLEDEWRKAVGLPPVTANAGGATRNDPNAQPTLVPFGAQAGSGSRATPAAGGQSSASQQDSEGDGGSSSLPVIAGSVLAIVLLTAGAVYLNRRRTAKGS